MTMTMSMTTKIATSCLAAAALAALAPACTGGIPGPTENDTADDPAPEPEPLAPELVGAGGRDVTEDWPDIDIPLSENARMLSFTQMRNEVKRATGRSWVIAGVDQWELKRAALGGADYVNLWDDDRVPSQQKLSVWREMAFSVCFDVVDAEANRPSRDMFALVDPGRTFSAVNPVVRDQVAAVFRHILLDDPTDDEIDESLSMLAHVQQLAGPREAWRNLCAAYLASMRFLTY
jgi:hypothetical protein